MQNGPQVPPMLCMPELKMEYRGVPILLPSQLPRTFESTISVEDAAGLCCGAWAGPVALCCMWLVSGLGA